MKHLALTVALLAAPCVAAPTLTTIVDTLYKADGTRFDGIAQIEWRSFQSADGSEIPQQTLNVKVVSGSLRVALVPTVDASKPVTYTVKFNSNGRTQFTEYWSVPASTTPLRLKDVRTTTQAGPITSPTPTSIDDVTGLRGELDIRPVKGNGFSTSRAAVINALGYVDGAIGNSWDCVRVDGTSGPCGGSGGGPLFADAEMPSGAMNGVNTSFTLAAAPSPATSLSLYRNGLLLRQGVGYTLSGSTITFLDGSIPLANDILQAWYRIPGVATQTVIFAENETPAGIVDSVNPAFTLQYQPSPASSLQLYRNGVLQKSGMDYVLSGKNITFSSWAIPEPGDVLQVSYRR